MFIKAPKALKGPSNVRINDENLTFEERNARKGEENMGTDGTCTNVSSKAEQHNTEGEWKALTSFDKNKQIRKEGKVQGGAPVNLNSKTFKIQK